MFGFEKLEVWQQAIQFANQIYRVSSGFPSDERFGLTSQLRRAAISISSNIAEGSGRLSKPEFARFVSIAYGSLMECVSQLHLANHQQYITDGQLHNLTNEADRVSRMLSGLRTSLLRKE